MNIQIITCWSSVVIVKCEFAVRRPKKKIKLSHSYNIENEEK